MTNASSDLSSRALRKSLMPIGRLPVFCSTWLKRESSTGGSRSQTYRTSTSGSDANVFSTPPPRPRTPIMQIEIGSFAAYADFGLAVDRAATGPAAAEVTKKRRRFMALLHFVNE